VNISKSVSAKPIYRVEQENSLIQSISILDIRVDIFTRSQFKMLILHYLKTKRRGWFSYINIHTIDVAQKISWFKEFLDLSLVSYCDGEGVRLGARLLGEHIPERITLSDYIYDIAEIAVEYDLKLFFLGGTSSVAERAAKKLKELHPALKISGYHHGFFPESENDSVINTINACQPDILFLGMGVPLQESWTKKNFPKLNVNLIWMGGGFLDTASGDKMNCPHWLGAIGFEWVFRLIQEPQRLWKRYLIGNPLFLLRILQARFLKR
jgi:N-acetylglucosaminyldiphosphoundecaprenol N-acetyl-beta-D-mannosaminyltransferase